MDVGSSVYNLERALRCIFFVFRFVFCPLSLVSIALLFFCHILRNKCTCRQLCDALETQMEEGGNVIDFHSCDFFPEHW